MSDSPPDRLAPGGISISTPLGSPDRWSHPFRTALDACLASSFPTFVWWGPELIQVYNQSSGLLLRGFETPPLGKPARDSWRDAWPIIGPAADRVLRSDEAALAHGVPIPLDGDANAPTHVDFYCNPVHDETGVVAGVFVVAVESIERAQVARLHETMLDAAVRLTGSDFASLQLFDPEHSELRLVAHRGFPAHVAAFWDRVGVESGTACGKALEQGERIVVTDVEEAPFIRNTIDLRVFRDAGIRAVQTTPLLFGDRLIGMLSTHWRRSYEPEPVELERFDLLAKYAAEVFAESA